jgi:hypothetical protein
MRFIQMRFLLLALLLALTEAASASTTWYVNGMTGNNANNCLSANTACKTIRHAVLLAASGDSIRVAPTTYTERLVIGSDLTIAGFGGRPVIYPPCCSTAVTISSASVKVTLSRITITGGNSGQLAGGGIINRGTLRLNDVRVTGNFAWVGGGIYNPGTLVISNSTINGNHVHSIEKVSEGIRIVVPGAGGGISNSGKLSVNRSTISGNTMSGTSLGGGIYNSGTLMVNNSTISENILVNAPTHYLSPGGGLFSNSGQVTISNSTVANNSAQVGGNIFGCQVSDCGDSGPVILQNSIVANSLSGGNCHGAVASDGYNLSSDNTCSLDNTGDMNSTDPMLGPLQNNGGPTMTTALLSGSPAIDAGNPSGCTDGQGYLLKTDQRGKPRPDPEDTGGCDMGAYENQTD